MVHSRARGCRLVNWNTYNVFRNKISIFTSNRGRGQARRIVPTKKTVSNPEMQTIFFSKRMDSRSQNCFQKAIPVKTIPFSKGLGFKFQKCLKKNILGRETYGVHRTRIAYKTSRLWNVTNM